MVAVISAATFVWLSSKRTFAIAAPVYWMFTKLLAINLPGLNVTVQQMLDALEAVAGPAVRARVRFERDERIAGIVANWPSGASAACHSAGPLV